MSAVYPTSTSHSTISKDSNPSVPHSSFPPFAVLQGAWISYRRRDPRSIWRWTGVCSYIGGENQSYHSSDPLSVYFWMSSSTNLDGIRTRVIESAHSYYREWSSVWNRERTCCVWCATVFLHLTWVWWGPVHQCERRSPLFDHLSWRPIR